MVNTVDNQPIAVTVGLTYRIPPVAVLPLLIRSAVPGISISRKISSESSLIGPQRFLPRRIPLESVKTANRLLTLLSPFYRRSRESVPNRSRGFSDLGHRLSDSFRASVEAAVKAKNEAVAAENTVNRIKFEAQQAVERANGEAAAKLKLADAERQSAILSAQGKAEGIRLEGESCASVLRINAEILKASPLVIDLARADRWNGALPQTLLEGTAATHFCRCRRLRQPKK